MPKDQTDPEMAGSERGRSREGLEGAVLEGGGGFLEHMVSQAFGQGKRCAAPISRARLRGLFRLPHLRNALKQLRDCDTQH